jgi:hypothetical protein
VDKLVFAKIIEKPTDRNGKVYLKITDQDNEIWYLFQYTIMPEINKAYLFNFEKDDKGYPRVSKIIPVVNIFKQEALKSIANRNDIIRNYSIAMTQAIQVLAILQNCLPEPEKLFNWAEKIYNNVEEKADSLMPKEN